MIVLSNEDLAAMFCPERLIKAVEAAARAADRGTAAAPERMHLHWDRNTLLVMPSIGETRLGTKLVSIVPGNALAGLPVTNGLMVVNDRATGTPLAILDAAGLTAQRTGAVGAMGIKYTCPDSVDSVGIVGAGVQGAWQAIFACSVRPIRRIFYVGRSETSTARFVQTVSRYVPTVELSRCRDAAELLSLTPLVITATTSAQPVLPDASAPLEGKHFVSVGSFRPEHQELPFAVYRAAGLIVVDSAAARSEVGDVINPLAQGIVLPENVVPIGAVMSGRRTIARDRTTVFKSVGMALYDLCVAEAFLVEAIVQGLGQTVHL